MNGIFIRRGGACSSRRRIQTVRHPCQPNRTCRCTPIPCGLNFTTAAPRHRPTVLRDVCPLTYRKCVFSVLVMGERQNSVGQGLAPAVERFQPYTMGEQVNVTLICRGDACSSRRTIQTVRHPCQPKKRFVQSLPPADLSATVGKGDRLVTHLCVSG